MKIKLSEVATAVQATNNITDYATVEISSVAFDSRDLKPGALFIPLVAENDGHDFFEDAKRNGATATLWAKDHIETAPKDFPVILVNDTLVGLQDLARFYLDKLNPKVIAVTGSNGKTTTKDLIAAVTSTQYNTIKTPENFNNEIGAPITILRMEKSTEVLVVELGMDRPGQLDFLSKLVKPDIAIITMIGEAHIEFFKTRDKIADAKLEITHGMKENGLFVYNGDEPLLKERAQSLNIAKKTFGLTSQDNDLYPHDIVPDDYATTFKTNQWPELMFTIPLLGEYNIENALAALIIGIELGISPENLQIALRNVPLTANRTQWMQMHSGTRVLSDVYNSNPTAAKEVLKAFSRVKTTGKRFVVLGDMLELGDDSLALHANLAKEIKENEIDGVYLVGEDVRALAQELKTTTNIPVKVYNANDKQTLVADLALQLTANDIILLKASHGIHLEQVVHELMK